MMGVPETFPEISGNFRKFPRQLFRKFPEISGKVGFSNFLENSRKFPEISGNYRKFPEISENFGKRREFPLYFTSLIYPFFDVR